MNRAQRGLIVAAVCVAGAALMALEILAFRIIGKDFGTALRETSVVISVFLFVMTCGYFAGGMAADRWPSPRTLLLALVLAAITSLVIPAVDDPLGDAVFRSSLPLWLHAFVVAVALFALPAFFLATATPVAVRLLLPSTDRAGRIAGVLSAVSTAGSIVGSLAAAFLMIDLFGGVDQSILVLALILFATAAALAIFALPPLRLQLPRNRFATLVVALLGLGILGNLALWLGARPIDSSRYQERNPRLRILHQRTTPYHSIMVTELDRRIRVLRFGRFYQSQMDLRDPSGPGFEYTDVFHMPRVLTEVRSVLFIGLGGGTGPKQFLKDCAGCTIDVAEIDPGVLEVARTFFFLSEDPRMRVATEDGRLFVRRTDRKYDLVVIDAFTTTRYGISIPWHLLTEEFFRELAARMTDQGHVVINTGAAPATELSRAIAKTMALVFPYQMVFAPGGQAVIVSSRMDTRAAQDELRDKVMAARERGVRFERLPARVEELLPAVPSQLGAPVLTDNYAPVDQLARRALSGEH